MQKSLGVYHDFACQAIASTTKNSDINSTTLTQTRKRNRTRQDPKKTKTNKKKPLFLEKRLDLVLTTLMKCPPNYTNQIIIKPQCGFF